MADRPNILLFMADQQRADALGPFGNDVVHTPNLDALAARGLCFDSAWGQHSVCGPSRVSMMTGWYPHVAGHRSLDRLLGPDEPNLLRSLRASGYEVAMPGHRGDVFAPGVTEASTDFCGYLVWPDLAGSPIEVAHPDGHPMYSAMYFGSQGQSPRLDGDEATVQTAIRWLQERRDDRPWAMWVPLVFPHPPFAVEEPWFSLHDRAEVPLPVPADAAVGKSGFVDAYRRIYGWDGVDEAGVREIVATYYGMVSRVDDQLGRLLATIDRLGQTDDTLVILTTDHGEYLGDWGLFEKWPSGLDPCLVRNPLIAAGPGVAEHRRCAAMVEMIDVTATILEVAEVEPTFTHFGRSLAPLFADPDRAHRTYACSEGGFDPGDVALFEQPGWIYERKGRLQHERPDLVGKAAAIRSPEATYVYRQCEGDELYDRVVDPCESVNRIDDPAYAPVRQALRDALLDWTVATSDVIEWDADPRFPDIPHGWR